MPNSHPYYFTWSHQPAQAPFPVERAEHDEFVLHDGRRVYDFLSTSFQANFGHSCQPIRESVVRQLDAMPIASPKASFELKERASHKLLEYLQLPNGKLFYTVSGSEAVENALKIARQVTGRQKVAARRKSYHGATLGALSVTGDWRNEPHFTLDDCTVRIPEPADDPDFAGAAQIIDDAEPDSIAAIIVETVSGANGVAIPTRAWFDACQATCREHGILLIVDEVLCGFGRTGAPFAFHSYGITPDLVCMAKGITGGYIPFGAVWTSADIASHYDEYLLSCGLTNYAHPLGLAAMEAVLQLLDDEGFQANKVELERLLAHACDEIRNWQHVAEVRCKGLLAAVDLVDHAAPTWDTLFASELHAFSKDNTLIVAPPFVSSPQRLRQAIDAMRQLLQDKVPHA